MGAADEMSVGHAHKLDVVDVAALAGNKASIFLAHDAGANAFDTHVLVSLPEFVSPPFPSKRGGLDSSCQLLQSSLFGGLRDSHAPGGVKHRLDDVVVTGAAADIAFELLPDGRFVKLSAVAVHDIDRRHDHARRAVAALKSVIVAEGGLHRVQLIAFRDAFDGGDVGTG